MSAVAEDHPELMGITFEYLPPEVTAKRGERIMTCCLQVRESCLFTIDLSNVDGPRWLLQRPAMIDWYENIQKVQQETQLPHGEAIVPPCSGLRVPFATCKLDNALTESAIIYKPRTKTGENKDIVISNMQTPFHDTANEMAMLTNYHSGLLQRLRSGVDDTRWRPHHVLVRLKMKRLLNLQHDTDMPDGTRNVCAYINSEESGFFGTRLIRRVFQQSMAPDMESGCNAMAMAHIMLEQLGCASMHSTCYLAYLAALQTMASKLGLAINPVLHGVGGAGKTHAMLLVRKLMLIDGTMVMEGYSSRLAMLGSQKVILDTVVVVDEGLDYYFSDSASGPSNVGPQESTLKLRLSESVISAKTLTHQDGKKVTVTQVNPHA